MARQEVEFGARGAGDLVQLAFSTVAGQRHSHLYVSGGGTEAISEAWYRVTYFERPPTSMRWALWLAVATTAFVSVVAAMQLAMPPGSGPDQGNSIGFAQLLIAFPLAIAALPAITGPKSVWVGALAARVITTISLMALVIAFILATLPRWFSPDWMPEVWSGLIIGLAATSFVAFAEDRARMKLHGQAIRHVDWNE
jgi:hypothetical protein